MNGDRWGGVGEERRALPPHIELTREPQRTCLGCRQVRPKASVLRLVRDADGRVRVDWDGSGAGRGAYVCPSAACLAKGLTKGRLDHAFRRSSTPPMLSAASILASAARPAGT